MTTLFLPPIHYVSRYLEGTLMGVPTAQKRGGGRHTPDQRPLGSVASYSTLSYADVRIFRRRITFSRPHLVQSLDRTRRVLARCQGNWESSASVGCYHKHCAPGVHAR